MRTRADAHGTNGGKHLAASAALSIVVYTRSDNSEMLPQALTVVHRGSLQDTCILT